MRRSSLALLLAAIAATAYPQDEPPAPTPALAHATGKATVSQATNTMVLGVTRVFEGETFEVLWPQAQQFRSDVIGALSDQLELATLNLTTEVELLDPPTLVARGGIVINFGPLLSQPEGDLALAKTLDKLLALCAELQLTPGDISYVPADESALKREAVRLATEQAFLPADAIAGALRSDLYTVDQVRVVSVEIDSGPEVDANGLSESLTGREVHCTAVVDVTYMLADRQ